MNASHLQTILPPAPAPITRTGRRPPQPRPTHHVPNLPSPATRPPPSMTAHAPPATNLVVGGPAQRRLCAERSTRSPTSRSGGAEDCAFSERASGGSEEGGRDRGCDCALDGGDVFSATQVCRSSHSPPQHSTARHVTSRITARKEEYLRTSHAHPIHLVLWNRDVSTACLPRAKACAAHLHLPRSNTSSNSKKR
jgi:hypothetical protein